MTESPTPGPHSPDEIAVVYLRHHRLKDNTDFWAWQEAHDAYYENPERAWIILLALVAQAEGKELEYVGAGLLEHLCESHGSQFIDRVEAQAIQDPKFKAALGSIWLNSLYVPEVIVRRLVNASGGLIEPFELDYEKAEAEDDDRAQGPDGA
jgi:hypothetical protein